MQQQRIIEAFVGLLSQQGFEGATFDELANLLDIRRTHVTYYFKTRENLIRVLSGVLPIKTDTCSVNFARINSRGDFCLSAL